MPPTKDIIKRTLATPCGEQAYHLIVALTDNGFDSWWVGGCVRDMLQGNLPGDIDIGTAARPEQVRKLFPKASGAGEQFGSLLLPLHGCTFEVTTFREDDETSDGRHPEAVVFGTREQDAKRRDFTVNALYFNPISLALYDPCGGEDDLRERLIRFIGDPAMRIRHDALRLLRAVRFRALLEGQYHPESYQALRELASLVLSLSGVRILGELERMLLGPHPDRALEDLWELTMLSHVLPELYACKGIPQPADYHHEGDVWDHLLMCSRSFTEEHHIDVRLATLLHDIGKVRTFSLQERIRFNHHASVSADLAESLLDRLQCSAKRRDKIVWIIRHHMMMGTFLEIGEERKGHWYYHPWFPELLQVFFLDIAGTDPADFSLYEKIVRDYHSFLDSHPRPLRPLLRGDEVMDILGIRPGEKVGECLKALHEAQVKGEVTTKVEARAFLKSAQV